MFVSEHKVGIKFITTNQNNSYFLEIPKKKKKKVLETNVNGVKNWVFGGEGTFIFI